MAKKIMELIDSKELRIKLGKEGRKLSNKYQKEEVAKIWYEFIDSCEKQIKK